MRVMSRVFVCLSVHEEFFDGVANRLRRDHGIEQWAGFCWGEDQAERLSQGVPYDPLIVFTRDILFEASSGDPDLEYLRLMEEGAPVPLTRMIVAERHMLAGRTMSEVLRLAEAIFRRFDAALDEFAPEWILAEDVSCLTSYIIYTLAKRKGIPIFILGYGRIPYHLAIYDSHEHKWADLDNAFESIQRDGFSNGELEETTAMYQELMGSKERPGDLEPKAGFRALSRYDVRRAVDGAKRYVKDRDNPTLVAPQKMVADRARRLVRDRIARARDAFSTPSIDRPYVIFPLHYEPEASTLVRAPYYMNQSALVEDIAKSLPTGVVLYVKEHPVARGRRRPGYYEHLQSLFNVEVIAPWEDSWTLVKNAAAVAVITSTMGWESLLCGRPTIVFGHAFYNSFPLVYRAFERPKEQWSELFHQAIYQHRNDPDLVLKYLAALRRSVFPGYIRNPRTLPRVLDPENLERVAASVAKKVGLGTSA